MILLTPALHTELSHDHRPVESFGLEFNPDGFQNWLKTGAHGHSATDTRHVLWELLFTPAFYFTRFYSVLGAKASCDCVTVNNMLSL